MAISYSLSFAYLALAIGSVVVGTVMCMLIHSSRRSERDYPQISRQQVLSVVRAVSSANALIGFEEYLPRVGR